MLRCEKFYRLLPAIRAIIAKELVLNYGISQEEVARMMNITQGAVSQYIRKRRGKTIIKSKNLENYIKELCENLKRGSNFEEELCKLCAKLQGEVLFLE